MITTLSRHARQCTGDDVSSLGPQYRTAQIAILGLRHFRTPKIKYLPYIHTNATHTYS